MVGVLNPSRISFQILEDSALQRKRGVKYFLTVKHFHTALTAHLREWNIITQPNGVRYVEIWT